MPLLIAVLYFIKLRPILLVTSLEPDEILTWKWATGSWNDLFEALSKDNQGWAYYIGLKFFNAVRPLSNDYWVRIPSLLTGSLGIFLIAKSFLKKNQELVGFILVAFLYLSHLFEFISTFARPYVFPCVLLFWIYSELSEQIESKERIQLKRSWLWVALAALYFHYLVFIPLAGLTLSLLLMRKKLNWSEFKFSSWPKIEIGIFLFLTIFLGILVTCQFKFRLLANNSLTVFEQPLDLILELFIPGGLLLIVFLLIVFILKLKDAFREAILFWEIHFVFLILICLLLVNLDVNTSQFRYMTFLIPGALLLLAGAVRFIEKTRDFKAYIFLLLFGLAFASSANGNLIWGDLRNRDGLKDLLVKIKKDNLGPDICVTSTPNFSYFSLIERYSKAYFEKTVCSEFFTRDQLSFDDLKSIAKNRYVLLMGLDDYIAQIQNLVVNNRSQIQVLHSNSRVFLLRFND